MSKKIILKHKPLKPSPLHKLKAECHKHFDKLWKMKGGMTRVQAYAWLAKQLNIPIEDCHFSRFDLKTLKQAKSLVIDKVSKMKARRQSLTQRRRARLCGLESVEEWKDEMQNFESRAHSSYKTEN